MLVECNYCGAPLDVRLNQRIARCAYCGTSSQVAATRTVAPETPPGWRAPTQWTPPAHVPADSAKVLLYHAANTVGRIVKLALTLAVLAVAILIAWVVARQSSGTSDVTLALKTAQDLVVQAQREASGVARMAAPAREDLFAGRAAADLAGKFAERLQGRPVRALELILYPEYAILQAQDPANPRHVDRYVYRQGVIGEPEPVRLPRLRRALEQHLVSLDEVRLERVPELIAHALSTLSYEQARVTHVIIQRNLPFSKHTVIRVYVSGPRESGRVDYTGAGDVLRVYK